MICYYINSLMRVRNYYGIVCKNNKRLVQTIDLFTIKILHDIIKISFLINYIYNIIFRLPLEDKYIIYMAITYNNETVV